MTISNSQRTAGPFAGNGVTATFPFAFKVFAQAEVVVVREVGALQQTLTLNSDYTVTLNGDQDANPGGIVTLTAPLATGAMLTMTSSVQETQGLVLTNNGGFYPKVIEAALDRLTILIQQLKTTTSRSLRFPISDSAVNQLPNKAARVNNLLGFDSNGNPVAVAAAAQSATALQIALATNTGATMVGTENGDTVAVALSKKATAAALAGYLARDGSNAMTARLQINAPGEGLTLNSSNAVAIACLRSTSGEKFIQVSANNLEVISSGYGGAIFTLDNAGNLTTRSQTSTSDERLKKKWRRAPSDLLERVARLRKLGNFLWKDGTPGIGGSAQEFEKIWPEAVHTDPVTGFKSFNYGAAAFVIAVELTCAFFRYVAKTEKRLADLERK